MNEKEIRNIWRIVALHLLPGAALTIIYIFLLRIGLLANLPKLILLGISAMLSIVPIELGYLFYVSRKEEGSYNIFKILGLKSKLKIREYIVYTFLLFIIAGIFLIISKPISNFLLNYIFSWIPSWFSYIQDMSLFSRNLILITTLVNLLVFTLIAPITEELYFRGFLLARMKWLGKYSVLLNVVFFAAYHFWSPWLIVSRIIAMLPLYYIVYKKNSLKLAILVHCFLNFTDVVTLIALL